MGSGFRIPPFFFRRLSFGISVWFFFPWGSKSRCPIRTTLPLHPAVPGEHFPGFDQFPLGLVTRGIGSWAVPFGLPSSKLTSIPNETPCATVRNDAFTKTMIDCAKECCLRCSLGIEIKWNVANLDVSVGNVILKHDWTTTVEFKNIQQ